MMQRKAVFTSLAASLLLTCLPCWAADVAGSAEEVQPLLVGSPMPSVPLKTDSGEDVDLQQAVGKKPSILIFYRGGW